jgi:transcription elongation factor Elf1
MEEQAEVTCPFCGQSFEVSIDTSVASQRFTTDCEVCCRPFQIVAECQPGEILSLDVQSE